jgi:protocatechuate 3,4-dioxygenase beta subunit
MMRCLVIALFCLVAAATSPSQTDAPKAVQKQSIQGKVIEAKSGQPVRKVNVEVARVQSYGHYSATTSGDGTFMIEDLEPGRYAVTLERTGFVNAATSGGQTTFILQPGQSLSGLVFKLQAAAVIAGKIVDIDGDPMANVSISATMTGTVARGAERSRLGYGMTNDRGEYRVADLRPGKYLISATPSRRAAAVHVEENGKPKEQLFYAPTYYPGTVDKSQATAVEVRAGDEASENFGVLTTHAYRITGMVAGLPTGETVQFLLNSKSGVTATRLREGNRFELENVLPGTYVATLVVAKGLESGGQPEMQMVRLNPSIEVNKTDLEGMQLQAEPSGQIRGMFRLDTGEKFDWTQLRVSLLHLEDNASETLSDIAASVRVSSRTSTRPAVNTDGTFEIKNVTGGNYQLVVSAHSEQLRDYYTKLVIFGGRDVADSGFALNGDVYLDVVVSAKGATIEGNVVDSNGQPVAYSTVAVVPKEHRARPDSYQRRPTDEHGQFVVRGLNPGSYVVLAFEELQEDMQQPEFLKMYAGKGEKVELEEGARKLVSVKIIPAETEAP